MRNEVDEWLLEKTAKKEIEKKQKREDPDLNKITSLKNTIYDYVRNQFEEGNIPPEKAEKAIKLLDRAEQEAMLSRAKGIPVKIKYLNLHFSSLFFSPSFFKIVYGGTNTGKSHCALGQYPLWRIIQEEGITYYAVKETKESLEGSIYRTMQTVSEQEGWEKYLKFGYKDGFPYIKSLTTGSEIFFRGLDKIEKLLSQHPTGFLIEEADFLTEDQFEELIRRIRGNDDSKKEVVMCFNPRPRGIWIKKRFFDDPNPEDFILKCHYTNNRFLTEGDIKRLEEKRNSNPADYIRFTEGDWYSEPAEEVMDIFTFDF